MSFLAGDAVNIKGTKHGLVIVLEHGQDYNSIKNNLIKKMEKAGDFFKGSRFSIYNHDSIHLVPQQEEELKDICRRYGLILNPQLHWPFRNQEQGTGLPQSNPVQGTDAPAEELNNQEVGEQATLVYHTLRSGQTISSKGHVVILGDINPGAKVTAGGHVLTMGKCAGSVHAGCPGNTKAVIIARSFSPATLGIAGIIAPTSPGVNKKGLLLVARINEHGMVTVEDFSMKL